MDIREATLADIDQIIHVDVTSYRDQFSDLSNLEMEFELEGRKDGYENLKSGKDKALVARENDSVVGYVQIGLKSDKNYEIKRVYILPEFQDQGLGRKLLIAALDGIEEATVYIDVWLDNYRAIHLYSSLGFKNTGKKIPFVNKDGEEDGYNLEMAMQK